MAKIDLTDLELEVLDRLLKGEDPVLETLRNQFASMTAISREITGHGFYLNFAVPDNAKRIDKQFSIKPDFCFGDVEARINSLKNGASFLLWIKDGALSCLEGYTYDESWPLTINSFELRYISGDLRDFERIRSAWLPDPIDQ